MYVIFGGREQVWYQKDYVIRSVKSVFEEHKIDWLLERHKRDKGIATKPSLDKCHSSKQDLTKTFLSFLSYN